MRRLKKAEYFAALILLSALTLLSCGCTLLGEWLTEAGATSVPAYETAAPASPTAAPSSIENPVFALFSDYNRLRAKAAKGLVGAAYDSEDALARTLITRLLREESMLSEVFATVGMLSRESEEAAFTGTLTGAYAGSGELLTDSTFSYRFDSGVTLSGSLEGRSVLRCDYCEGSSICHLMLFRASEGFMLRVVSGGETGVLEISAGGVRYACGASSLIKGEGTGAEFPKAEGLSYLYWVEGALSCED